MKLVKKSLFKIAGVGILVVICFGIAGACYFYFDPIGFRINIFRPARELLFFNRELCLISHWDKIEKAVVASPQKIMIPHTNENDVEIIADLRIPQGKGPFPVILLLHGSSPWGRKNGLILRVAHEFYKANWIVLSPDARGFGETSDPTDISIPERWNVKNDIRRCINYLYSLPETDTDRLYVLGHSRGAGHALEGALDDPNVKALVLVGPPRFRNGYNTSLWERVRYSAIRDLKTPVSAEIVKFRAIKSDLSLYIKGQLKNNNHLPILFIDGELEDNQNLYFLSKLVSEIRPPVAYQTLKGAGHYCGVYNWFGSDVIYFRPDVFDPFMEILFGFFQNVENKRI